MRAMTYKLNEGSAAQAQMKIKILEKVSQTMHCFALF